MPHHLVHIVFDPWAWRRSAGRRARAYADCRQAVLQAYAWTAYAAAMTGDVRLAAVCAWYWCRNVAAGSIAAVAAGIAPNLRRFL